MNTVTQEITPPTSKTLGADGRGRSLKPNEGRPQVLAGRRRPGRSRHPGSELQRVLSEVAQRIAEDGTRGSAAVLEAVSTAVQPVSLGVAAALVDWEASDVARQRAFGIAHRLVVEVVEESAQSLLLDRIEVAPHGGSLLGVVST